MATKKTTQTKAKAKKPSTYAGIGAALAGLIPFLPPQYQLAGSAVAALAGVVATFLPVQTEAP